MEEQHFWHANLGSIFLLQLLWGKVFQGIRLYFHTHTGEKPFSCTCCECKGIFVFQCLTHLCNGSDEKPSLVPNVRYIYIPCSWFVTQLRITLVNYAFLTVAVRVWFVDCHVCYYRTSSQCDSVESGCFCNLVRVLFTFASPPRLGSCSVLFSPRPPAPSFQLSNQTLSQLSNFSCVSVTLIQSFRKMYEVLQMQVANLWYPEVARASLHWAHEHLYPNLLSSPRTCTFSYPVMLASHVTLFFYLIRLSVCVSCREQEYVLYIQCYASQY